MFYFILFFSTFFIKSMVNDNQKSLSISFIPIQYLNDSVSLTNAKCAGEIPNLSDTIRGEFVYKKSGEKKELRGVFLDKESNIMFVGNPCRFNNDDQFFSWGKRTQDIFFLHSYNDENMFDYLLYLNNSQQMQIFSFTTKKLYRQITTKYKIKLHDSSIGLEKELVENFFDNKYRWRESFVFTINCLNSAYHFRYLVKDGTIILFDDGTTKLNLKDSKYFSDTSDRFFYFGSKDYVVDRSNDRVFYLIKNKNKEVIGTVFMGFLSKNIQTMLDAINQSSNNEKTIDSCIQFFKGFSTWIRLKIVFFAYFFKIKHEYYLPFKNFFKWYFYI